MRPVLDGPWKRLPVPFIPPSVLAWTVCCNIPAHEAHYLKRQDRASLVSRTSLAMAKVNYARTFPCYRSSANRVCLLSQRLVLLYCPTVVKPINRSVKRVANRNWRASSLLTLWIGCTQIRTVVRRSSIGEI